MKYGFQCIGSLRPQHMMLLPSATRPAEKTTRATGWIVKTQQKGVKAAAVALSPPEPLGLDDPVPAGLDVLLHGTARMCQRVARHTPTQWGWGGGGHLLARAASQCSGEQQPSTGHSDVCESAPRGPPGVSLSPSAPRAVTCDPQGKAVSQPRWQREHKTKAVSQPRWQCKHMAKAVSWPRKAAGSQGKGGVLLLLLLLNP